MRDIRSDLLERANLMEERIKAANAHCEEKVKQLQKERDATVAELKSGIAMLGKLMEFEQGQMSNVEAARTRPVSPKLSVAAG
jgi:6-phosphogluconate dehydrogenase